MMPDIRDVPCPPCQTMRDGHECDEPRYCACLVPHLPDASGADPNA